MNSTEASEAKWTKNAKLILDAFDSQDEYTIFELSELLHISLGVMRSTVTRMQQCDLIRLAGGRRTKTCHYERIEGAVVPASYAHAANKGAAMTPHHDEIHERFFKRLQDDGAGLEHIENVSCDLLDEGNSGDRGRGIQECTVSRNEIWRYRGQ